MKISRRSASKLRLVTTIVNTINNDAIGDIVKFAAENIDKVQTIAFQPVSFTGRDEDISDKDRIEQRYTLAGMTHDLKDQLDGNLALEPLRDWFPLSVVFGVYIGDGYAARRGRAVGLVVVQLSSELRNFYARRRQ